MSSWLLKTAVQHVFKGLPRTVVEWPDATVRDERPSATVITGHVTRAAHMCFHHGNLSSCSVGGDHVNGSVASFKHMPDFDAHFVTANRAVSHGRSGTRMEI